MAGNVGLWVTLGAVGAIVLLVLGVAGSAVGTYNELVDERESVDAQSKQVDVQYQRANRLLAKLEDLAKQYMKNETDVLARIAGLRSGLSDDASFEGKDAASEELLDLVLLVGARLEAYPELKSARLFEGTMAEITGTENRIAMEKVRYNDRVEEYNAHRKRCCLPTLLAGWFGFEEKEYIGYKDRPNQSDFGEQPLIAIGRTPLAG